MAVETFEKVQMLLVSSKAGDEIKCIAPGCHQILPDKYRETAIEQLEQHKNAESEEDSAKRNRYQVKGLRGVIAWLLCPQQHQKPKFEKEIEKGWWSEFPDLFFDIQTHTRRPRASLSTSDPSTPTRKTTPGPELSFGDRPEIDRSPATAQELSRAKRAVKDKTIANSRRKIHGDALRSGMQKHPPETIEISDDDQPTEQTSPLAIRGRQKKPLQVDSTLEGDAGVKTEDTNRRRDGEVNQGASRNENDTNVQSVFEYGKQYDWAPWTIRGAVCDLILEPIPIKHGTIYIIPDKTKRYVKIGKTEQPIKKDRIKHVINEHHDILDEGSLSCFSNIPIHLLGRLEALIHRDLAYFQRYLKTDKGKTREWFEISLTEAEETVKLWLCILKTLNQYPGDQVGEETRNRLRESDYFQSSKYPVSNIQAVQRKYNEDHVARKEVWKMLFLSEQKPNRFVLSMTYIRNMFCSIR